MVQWLRDIGIPDDCIENRSSASESGRTFSVRPIRGQNNDEIWRIHVDGCLVNDNTKRVDYIFWGQSAGGRRAVLLVELKGQHFGRALQQIASTLQLLCKRSPDNVIHNGNHRNSPGHEIHSHGGVQAYVVLSKGKGVRQYLNETERIRKQYGVRIITGTKIIESEGLDNLLNL